MQGEKLCGTRELVFVSWLRYGLSDILYSPWINLFLFLLLFFLIQMAECL